MEASVLAHPLYNSTLSANLYYVYEDWTGEENPRCFYVGKGKQKRVCNLKRNKKHASVSAKYGHRRRVVYETSSNAEASAMEVALIAKHGTFETDLGCNFTRGGDGVSAPSVRKGQRLSEGHRANISRGKKGKPTHWSRPKTPAFKARLSTVLTGIKRSDTTKKKLSDYMRGRALRARPVEQLDETGKILARFDQLSFACAAMRTSSRALIRNCCDGKRADAYGFTWRWA